MGGTTATTARKLQKRGPSKKMLSKVVRGWVETGSGGKSRIKIRPVEIMRLYFALEGGDIRYYYYYLLLFFCFLYRSIA